VGDSSLYSSVDIRQEWELASLNDPYRARFQDKEAGFIILDCSLGAQVGRLKRESSEDLFYEVFVLDERNEEHPPLALKSGARINSNLDLNLFGTGIHHCPLTCSPFYNVTRNFDSNLVLNVLWQRITAEARLISVANLLK
jgi:hypothetical protein